MTRKNIKITGRVLSLLMSVFMFAAFMSVSVSAADVTCKPCMGTGVCAACGGTGSADDNTCSVCGGTGNCRKCGGEGRTAFSSDSAAAGGSVKKASLARNCGANIADCINKSSPSKASRTLISNSIKTSSIKKGEAYGAHLTSAFYKSGSSYATKDGKLSTTSGKCDLYINGKNYTTDVVYIDAANRDYGYADDRESWDVFRIESTGDEFVGIGFRYDKCKAGQVYTVSDYTHYKGNREYSRMLFLRKSADNIFAYSKKCKDGYYRVPINGKDSEYSGISVRVVQSDKKGDTVIYFAFKAKFDGTVYDVEGLAAAPYSGLGKKTDNSNHSLFDEECHACFGSGDCFYCGGKGGKTEYNVLTKRYETVRCNFCGSTGRCTKCGGRGYN